MCRPEVADSSNRDLSLRLDLNCLGVSGDSVSVSGDRRILDGPDQGGDEQLLPLPAMSFDTFIHVNDMGWLSGYEGAFWPFAPRGAYIFWGKNPYDAAGQLNARRSLEGAHSGSVLLWSNGLELRAMKTRDWGVVLFILGRVPDAGFKGDRFEIALGPDVKPFLELNMRDFLTEEVMVIKPIEPPEGPLTDRGRVSIMPSGAAYSAPETHFLALQTFGR